MKYEIDTIPVWDALRSGAECPFCALEVKTRARLVQYYLGPSVMVPETRVEVNRVGFSAANWQRLAQDPSNRLGFGLIVSTRLRELRSCLSKPLQRMKDLAGAPKGLFAPKPKAREAVDAFLKAGREATSGCLIEEKLRDTLNRYLYTAVHLWTHDGEFPPAFAASKGVCLPHAFAWLDLARDHLDEGRLASLAAALAESQDRALGRLEEETVYFTQMFDSRNHGQDWKGTQDAPLRSAQKMNGLA